MFSIVSPLNAPLLTVQVVRVLFEKFASFVACTRHFYRNNHGVVCFVGDVRRSLFVDTIMNYYTNKSIFVVVAIQETRNVPVTLAEGYS